MFVLRRRGFPTRKLSSDPCGSTHPTTQATQPQPRQPESEQKRRKTTQGAYGAMRAVNRQPWYPQRRGWAQVRIPKNPMNRVPRQPPEEHLEGPPPQVRRKLRLRQGAISNENAALAGRRARFQGIGFFKASGGELGPHILLQGGAPFTICGRGFRRFLPAGQKPPKTAPAYSKGSAPLALRTPQQVLRW